MSVSLRLCFASCSLCLRFSRRLRMFVSSPGCVCVSYDVLSSGLIRSKGFHFLSKQQLQTKPITFNPSANPTPLNPRRASSLSSSLSQSLTQQSPSLSGPLSGSASLSTVLPSGTVLPPALSAIFSSVSVPSANTGSGGGGASGGGTLTELERAREQDLDRADRAARAIHIRSQTPVFGDIGSGALSGSLSSSVSVGSLSAAGPGAGAGSVRFQTISGSSGQSQAETRQQQTRTGGLKQSTTSRPRAGNLGNLGNSGNLANLGPGSRARGSDLSGAGAAIAGLSSGADRERVDKEKELKSSEIPPSLGRHASLAGGQAQPVRRKSVFDRESAGLSLSLSLSR